MVTAGYEAANCLAESGFLLAPQIIDAASLAAIIEAWGASSGAGRRGVLEMQGISELTNATTLLDLVRPHVSGEPFAVRAIYFNKSAAAN